MNNDLISREALLAKLWKATKGYRMVQEIEAVKNCILEVKDAPAVEAVPIVRCKDCIHRFYIDLGSNIGGIGGCELFTTPMMILDDFCSYGERRVDND